MKTNYKNLGEYNLSGKGRVIYIENDQETMPRDELSKLFLGKTITIDGVEYKVRGVESYATMHTYKGEKLGILV